MNISDIILLIFILSLLLNIYLIIYLHNQKNIEGKYKLTDREIYSLAIDVFNSWKNEIGGVSLKGVGQHYEKWIWKKLNGSKNIEKKNIDA